MPSSAVKGLLETDGFGQPIEWLEESKCFRICGIRGLKYSIQYLSQAIKVCSGPLLAVAYCLQSFCTEDDEPNSEQVFDDIKSALDVWSDIPTSDGSMMPENTMCGLCRLSPYYIQGYECYLYQERSPCGRLSHALCPSPVQEAFMSLSDVFGEKLKSNDFWIECLSGSQPLKVGFKNSFSASLSSTTVINCNPNSI